MSGDDALRLGGAVQGLVHRVVPGCERLLVGLGLFCVFLGVLASLVAPEFLPSRRKPILPGSLGLSIFAHGLMGFAET
jgi:hypothetical protein